MDDNSGIYLGVDVYSFDFSICSIPRHGVREFSSNRYPAIFFSKVLASVPLPALPFPVSNKPIPSHHDLHPFSPSSPSCLQYFAAFDPSSSSFPTCG